MKKKRAREASGPERHEVEEEERAKLKPVDVYFFPLTLLRCQLIKTTFIEK
jgi:hypothetical protein